MNDFSPRFMILKNLREPWREPVWQQLTRLLLDSFRHWVGRELMPCDADPEVTARALFEAPFVVVAHDTQPDPIFQYGNRTALELWNLTLDELLQMPSRLTAEPVHRDERARLMERTRLHGFIDDYAGVRISKTGQRFRIEQAIIWNVVDAQGNLHGQAATFTEWTPLG